MILLRTHVFGDRERALMERLRAVRGHAVAVAVDETRHVLDVAPFAKVSVTRAACEGLGLVCPSDFAWRNGDYVFYLARRQFPEETHFWLMEPDVAHSFASDQALFDFFDQGSTADLLVPYLHTSTDEWWWRQTAKPRATGIKRAMFCFLRMSARAADVCLQERRKARFSLRDRLYWPNDEAFVATEVVYAGLPAADLNDLGEVTYTPETLGFERPIDGTDGTFRREPNFLYHPVLYGEAYRARVERIGQAGGRGSRVKKLRRKLQRMLG